MTFDLIYLINFSASLFMTGLIWYVQLVHYPAFRFIPEESFKSFHDFHNLKTGFIVMPVMITELVSSGLLWKQGAWLSINAIGFYIVLAIWLSTFFLSVPLHAKLNQQKNDRQINQLVSTNWVRTVLWTLKSGLSAFILYS